MKVLSKPQLEAALVELRALSEKGTGCVTLVLPAGCDLASAKKTMAREAAVAVNIRDRV